MIIHQPADSDVIAIPIAGRFKISYAGPPILKTEVLASTVSCSAISRPSYNLSQTYTVQRCLNSMTGWGYYSVTASPWNSRVIIRGRLVGFIVQEFKVIHFENRTGLLLAFHVPMGYEYSAFASTDYIDFDNGMRSTFNGGKSPAIFNDSFFLAGLNDSVHNSPPCNFSDSNNDKKLVSYGYWIMSRNILPKDRWLFGLNGAPFANMLKDSIYHPFSCSIPIPTEEQVNTKANLCFIGDSHMRHMANAISRLLSGLAPQTPASITTDKGVNLHPRVLYRMEKFGESVLGDQYDLNDHLTLISFLSRCDVTIANFGQWALGWPVDPYPWEVDVYARQVLSYLSVLKTLTSGKLLWLTVNPTPYNEMSLSKHEWRTPYLLRRFALASIEVSRKVGVRCLDVNAISSSLSDLSYDNFHYMAPVQSQLAQLTFHIILDIFNKYRNTTK